MSKNLPLSSLLQKELDLCSDFTTTHTFLTITPELLDQKITFNEVLCIYHNGTRLPPKWQFVNQKVHPEVTTILNLLSNISTEPLEILLLCIQIPDFGTTSIKNDIVNLNFSNAIQTAKLLNLH